MNTVRAFVAIELPPHILTHLENLQSRMKQDVPAGLVRWVKSEGIHLTLQFLGDVPTTQIEAIAAAIQAVCVSYTPFVFHVGGLGCFPNLRRPNVIWVGVDEPGGILPRLQRDIEQSLKPLGFKPEDRKFSPHLTLGRIKGGRPAELQALGEYITHSKVQIGEAQAAAVHLIRSELLPGGAVYTSLAEAPLAAHVGAVGFTAGKSA